MSDYITENDSDEWDYTESDILIKFPFFDVLKDGRVHVLSPPIQIIPPSDDYIPGVKFKDVIISPDVSVRIFLPLALTTAAAAAAASTVNTSRQRRPLLFYMHGSGYCMESPFSVDYTRYVGHLSAEANVVAVSVKYGLFPERPIPACYEDCMAAILWVAAHARPSSGVNIDPWIKDYADLSQIFVAGDSAGGNISHYLMSRVGSTVLLGDDVNVEGMFMVHPHFGEDDKMWMYMCPTNTGPTDPRLKPAAEDLARIGCGRVLVVVAEKDDLRDAGKAYVEELIKSGWKGKAELVENKDRDHCFHIYQPQDPEAVALQQIIISFINQN